MDSYTHLTQVERYQIFALMRAGHPHNEIATLLGRSPSTIGRELRRNRGQRGYRPKQAHALASVRARCCRTRPRITEPQWLGIAELLRQDLSPEQIAERARREGTLVVSHESIYQFVYADKAAGGKLWQYLRCQKPRRKRYGHYDRRGQIPGRVGIENRPAGVASRRRLGHWEGDTMIGRRSCGGGLLTLVERKSRITLIGALKNRKSKTVERHSTRLLGPFQSKVYSLTFDNGMEFACHQAIAKAIRAKIYFAHPHAAWERGTNENTNGLIRQYFPKHMDFRLITTEMCQAVMDRLNHRPRKCLGYKTPYEVFFNTTTRLTVALRG
jgi:IS30 family transposase